MNVANLERTLAFGNIEAPRWTDKPLDECLPAVEQDLARLGVDPRFGINREPHANRVRPPVDGDGRSGRGGGLLLRRGLAGIAPVGRQAWLGERKGNDCENYHGSLANHGSISHPSIPS